MLIKERLPKAVFVKRGSGTMVRKIHKKIAVSEDSFGKTRSVFEFHYQNLPETQTAWNPNMDIYETENDLVVTIEAAGLKKDSLTLQAIDNRLILSGERKQFVDEEVIRYYQLEIPSAPFQKTVILPGPIDEDRVDAQYRNGLLTIRVSKKGLEGDDNDD